MQSKQLVGVVHERSVGCADALGWRRDSQLQPQLAQTRVEHSPEAPHVPKLRHYHRSLYFIYGIHYVSLIAFTQFFLNYSQMLPLLQHRQHLQDRDPPNFVPQLLFSGSYKACIFFQHSNHGFVMWQ